MANSSQNIPGYTGFVPYKCEFVGRTTCDSNKGAEHAFRQSNMSKEKVGAIIRDYHAGQVIERSNAINTRAEMPENNLILGMRSKDSKTWMNGPTHEIRNQVVPGYTGFIPGVKSENVYSHTYSNNTAKSFENQIGRTATNFDVIKPTDRFVTTQNKIYSPQSSRRILENADKFKSRRDYLEYSISVNESMKKEKEQFLRNSRNAMDAPLISKTHNSIPPVATTFSPRKFEYDLNGSPHKEAKEVQVRPRIL